MFSTFSILSLQDWHKNQEKNDDEDEEEEDKTNWDEDEEEEEDGERPSFPEFSGSLARSIEELGGEVFCKLNWSSPRDATWVALGNREEEDLLPR